MILVSVARRRWGQTRPPFPVAAQTGGTRRRARVHGAQARRGRAAQATCNRRTGPKHLPGGGISGRPQVDTAPRWRGRRRATGCALAFPRHGVARGGFTARRRIPARPVWPRTAQRHGHGGPVNRKRTTSHECGVDNGACWRRRAVSRRDPLVPRRGLRRTRPGAAMLTPVARAVDRCDRLHGAAGVCERL